MDIRKYRILRHIICLIILVGLSAGSLFADGATDNAATPIGENATANGIFGSQAINDLNIVSGRVSLQYPVYKLAAGNAAFEVALQYSSHVRYTLIHENKYRQTSWVGLGWQLGTGAILADLKKTETRGDDEFCLLGKSGGKNKIFKIDSTYYLQKYDYEKIQYDSTNDYWTVTKKDGTKYIYGNSQDARCTRLADDEGDVGNFEEYDTGLEPITFRWNLSSIEDIYGNTIDFEYYQEIDTVTVFSTKYTYTRAFYPKSITDNRQGNVISFILGTRTDSEYEEASTEEDEYESYETRYLTSITVCDKRGQLIKKEQLYYSLKDIDSAGPWETKRYLTGIREYASDNGTYIPVSYTYNENSTGNNPGAMLKWVDKKGIIRQYVYGDLFEEERTEYDGDTHSESFINKLTADALKRKFASHKIVTKKTVNTGQEGLWVGEWDEDGNGGLGEWGDSVKIHPTRHVGDIIPRLDDGYVIGIDVAGQYFIDSDNYGSLNVVIISKEGMTWDTTETCTISLESYISGANILGDHGFREGAYRITTEEDYFILAVRHFYDIGSENPSFDYAHIEDGCSFDPDYDAFNGHINHTLYCNRLNERKYYDKIYCIYKDGSGWHLSNDPITFSGYASWQFLDQLPEIMCQEDSLIVRRIHNPEPKYAYWKALGPDSIFIHQNSAGYHFIDTVTGYLTNFYENYYVPGSGYGFAMSREEGLYTPWGAEPFCGDRTPAYNPGSDLVITECIGTIGASGISSFDSVVVGSSYQKSGQKSYKYYPWGDDSYFRLEYTQNYAQYSPYPAFLGNTYQRVNFIHNDTTIKLFRYSGAAWDFNFYPGQTHSYLLVGGVNIHAYSHIDGHQHTCSLTGGGRLGYSGLVNLGYLLVTINSDGEYAGLWATSGGDFHFLKSIGLEKGSCNFYRDSYIMWVNNPAHVFEDGATMETETDTVIPDYYMENINWYPLERSIVIDGSRRVEYDYIYADGDLNQVERDPKYNVVYCPKVEIVSQSHGTVEYDFVTDNEYSLLCPGLIQSVKKKGVDDNVVKSTGNEWEMYYVRYDTTDTVPYYNESILYARPVYIENTLDGNFVRRCLEYNDANGLVSAVYDSNLGYVKGDFRTYAFESDNDSATFKSRNMLTQISGKMVCQINGAQRDTLRQGRTLWRDDATYGFLVPDEEQVHDGTGYFIKAGDITYDSCGNVLSYSDARDVRQSSIMGYNDSKVIASIQNAPPGLCAYTGFEDQELDGWLSFMTPGPSFDSTNYYTGEYGLKLSDNFIYRNFQESNGFDITKDYILSARIKLADTTDGTAFLRYSINGVEKGSLFVNDRKWNVVAIEIPKEELQAVQSTFLTLKAGTNITGGKCYLDDIRFHPADAFMTTYTYDTGFDVITSETDKSNRTTWNAYDAFGRLSGTYNMEQVMMMAKTRSYNNEQD